MKDKKQSEYDCLNLTKSYINNKCNLKTRKYIYSLIPFDDVNIKVEQSERPDFVINSDKCSYAVEHFLIDFCYDGPANDQSMSKRANRNVFGIYEKYHDHTIGTIKDEDINSAVADIEKEINNIENIAKSFSYEKYIDGFKRVYEQHYNRVESYRANVTLTNPNIKVGFLIELHCDPTLVQAVLNGSLVSFKSNHKPFPITKEIIELFRSSTELDFIILSQFNEGVFTEAHDVRLFEPNRIDASLDKQRIQVYDRIVYPNITKNIKLNIEKG